MNNPIIFVASLLLMFIGSEVYGQSLNAAEQDEIQVLIDVSGSMKQNDPQNLRIEASKLLISLLPEKSKAAIWIFAENTTALTHSDAVDDAWKKQALKATGNIHSRGLYTHIEEAIQTALKTGFAGNGNKNLIILTDGVVDISKDIMVSADSRERILSEWIPKLQQQNIKVQTIALSDQADKELLDKLAFDTGGWTESAESAEQLQRAFLKMAQKAAPKDSLPLVGNQFTVDSGVKEFSVLVFKKSGSAPTRLQSPDRKQVDKQTSTANVAWLEGSAYDLVTVKQPGVGDWRLEAEVDPDNQVMIMTDLKLVVDELPNFIGDKESFAVRVHFTEHDKPIERADFLGMMAVTLTVDQQVPLAMQAVAGEKGFFAHTVSSLSPGKHRLKIVADGKTFKRESDREIEVTVSSIAMEQSIDAEKREVTLKLIPDLTLLDANALRIEANISSAGKPPETQAIENQDGAWLIKLDGLEQGSETLVSFNVMAKSVDGKPVSPEIKPIKINDEFFRKNAQPSEKEPQQFAAEEHVAQSEQSAESHEQTTGETNWLLVGLIVLGMNILLFGCGYFIYRALKKANAEKQQQLLERLA